MENKARIFLLIAVLVFVGMGNVYAQPLYSLSQILDRVEQHHPMLEMYNQKMAAYDAYAEGTAGWMAPMVGVGTFMTPYPNQEIMHENEKGAWMFSMEQEIPNPAKQKSAKDYYKALGLVEEKNFYLQRQKLRAETKSLFYKGFVTLHKQHITQENITILEAMLQWTKQQYAINKAALTDVYKTESILEELKAMYAMQQADYLSTLAQLTTLMNIKDSILLDTVGVLQSTLGYTFTSHAEVFSTRALEQLDQTINAMEFDQARQKAQRKPDFKIRFDHMQPIGNMPKQYSAMAMISIPIAPWSSKMYKSEVKGMQYDIDAMKKEREGMTLETVGMLNSMVISLEQMQKQLLRYKDRILPALKRNVAITRVAYNENEASSMMMLESWETYTMMQDEYWSKWDEFLTMIIRYETILDK